MTHDASQGGHGQHRNVGGERNHHDADAHWWVDAQQDESLRALRTDRDAAPDLSNRILGTVQRQGIFIDSRKRRLVRLTRWGSAAAFALLTGLGIYTFTRTPVADVINDEPTPIGDLVDSLHSDSQQVVTSVARRVRGLPAQLRGYENDTQAGMPARSTPARPDPFLVNYVAVNRLDVQQDDTTLLAAAWVDRPIGRTTAPVPSPHTKGAIAPTDAPTHVAMEPGVTQALRLVNEAMEQAHTAAWIARYQRHHAPHPLDDPRALVRPIRASYPRP